VGTVAEVPTLEGVERIGRAGYSGVHATFLQQPAAIRRVPAVTASSLQADAPATPRTGPTCGEA